MTTQRPTTDIPFDFEQSTAESFRTSFRCLGKTDEFSVGLTDVYRRQNSVGWLTTIVNLEAIDLSVQTGPNSEADDNIFENRKRMENQNIVFFSVVVYMNCACIRQMLLLLPRSPFVGWSLVSAGDYTLRSFVIKIFPVTFSRLYVPVSV